MTNPNHDAQGRFGAAQGRMGKRIATLGKISGRSGPKIDRLRTKIAGSLARNVSVMSGTGLSRPTSVLKPARTLTGVPKAQFASSRRKFRNH